MLSNDILRSVRYILKANNNDLVRILALGNVEATAEQIAVWLRKEDEEGFQRCPDIVLSSFLNGLIYEKRGKDESAPALEPERRINNNIVLKKLRIAFSLKTDDILAILTEQQFRVSMPEITAMMRAPDHKNFRECGDGRNYELVGNARIVARLHGMYGVGIIVTLAVYHGGICLFYPLKAVVPVHGVIASHYGGYFTHAYLGYLPLVFLNEPLAAFGRNVTW